MIRLIMWGIVACFLFAQAHALAETTQGAERSSSGLTAGAGYGFPSGKYFADSQDDLVCFADLRIGMSPRSYLKLGYRNQKIYKGVKVTEAPYPWRDYYNQEISLRQYLLMVGLVTSPKSNGDPSVGYVEWGVGYGSIHHDGTHEEGGPLQLMIAGQGGVRRYFGQDRNFGLDLGLSFQGCSFFDRDEGTGIILGVQLGFLVDF